MMHKNLMITASNKQSAGKSDWFNTVVVKGKKQWIVSFNLKEDKVIVEEFFDSEYGILIKNTRQTDIRLMADLGKVFKNTDAPKSTWGNSIKKFWRELEKEIAREKLKTGAKRKLKGRPRENYLRKATLKAITTQKAGETRTATAKKIFPQFQKFATSEVSFIAGVLRNWTDTDKAFREQKNQELSHKDFAKNYLRRKPKPRIYRRKPTPNK